MGFNSLQVGYKPGVKVKPLQSMSFTSFNSLQVGYKRRHIFLPPLSSELVSIPYRLATNGSIWTERQRFGQRFQFLIGWLQTTVEIFPIMHGVQFQFLIGWLQTSISFFYSSTKLVKVFQFLIGWLQTSNMLFYPAMQTVWFQFLIGWLQTLFYLSVSFLPPDEVSIPYRLATNFKEVPYANRLH